MRNLLFIILLLAISCKESIEENTEIETNEWAELSQKLDSLFSAHINSDEPGVAVLVVYNDEKIFAKGYGVRNVESLEPITPSTNLETASVSKQFTALSVLSLVNDGKLSLSDTIYQYIPSDSFKNVTIEQLLYHTSGLGDAESYFYTHWDSTKIAKNEDIINWYKQENRTINNPGEVFHYNNGAYEILPVIVEIVSGQDYSTYIREHIFEKLGMENSVAFNLNEPLDIKERAKYYSKDSLGVWQEMDGHPLTGLAGAGGIYTSLNDYFNYDTKLRGKFIFKDSINKLIFKPNSRRLKNNEMSNYAMGWRVSDSLAEHSGGWFGVNTFTRRYLDRPLSMAFLANRDDFMNLNLIERTDSIVRLYIKETN